MLSMPPALATADKHHREGENMSMPERIGHTERVAAHHGVEEHDMAPMIIMTP